jgi:hypothetical protein
MSLASKLKGIAAKQYYALKSESEKPNYEKFLEDLCFLSTLSIRSIEYALGKGGELLRKIH